MCPAASSGAGSRSQAGARRGTTAQPPAGTSAGAAVRGDAPCRRVGGVSALGLDDGLECPVPLPLVVGLAGGPPLYVGDAGLDLGEGGVAALGPVLQGGDDAGDGARLDVPQGRDGGDLDDGAEGVQLGVEEAGVDGGDDEVLDLAGGGEAEVLLQGRVGQVLLVAAEGEEGELAELEPLAVVEVGQVRGRGVGGVEAVAEELELGEVGLVLWGAGEGLDGGADEELREDVGALGRGRVRDEVGGCLGRVGGLGERQEGLGAGQRVAGGRGWARGPASRALRALDCSMMADYGAARC